MWVGMQTFWKAFISLILDLQKSGSFESEFKDEAAIDVYGYDYPQSEVHRHGESRLVYHTA